MNPAGAAATTSVTTACGGLSQVKLLEAGLKQAKQDESGRNALIKQVTALEEENKHSRQRLDTRQAEALVRALSRFAICSG